MQTIQEIKEEFENRLSSETQENLLFKEIAKYYKKKRFLFPVVIISISGLIFWILNKYFWTLEKDIPIIIFIAFISSMVIAFFIPVIHVLLKKEKGQYNELLKKERNRLLTKWIKEAENEIENLKKERDNFDEYISEREAEKEVLKSML